MNFRSQAIVFAAGDQSLQEEGLEQSAVAVQVAGGLLTGVALHDPLLLQVKVAVPVLSDVVSLTGKFPKLVVASWVFSHVLPFTVQVNFLV